MHKSKPILVICCHTWEYYNMFGNCGSLQTGCGK